MGESMFKHRKKLLNYIGKLCVLAVALIIVMKLLGKNLGDSIMPILVLAVAGNGISYILYKQK